MLEPKNNPNPSILVNPPGWARTIQKKMFDRVIQPQRVDKRREKAEAQRRKANAPHIVEYFHQLDDPYAHLVAQVLAKFAERYDVVIKTRLIRATGGKDQPELEKLRQWSRTDAGLIAPYYGLSFPADAPVVPDAAALAHATEILAPLSAEDFIQKLETVSTHLWQGDTGGLDAFARGSAQQAQSAVDQGSERIQALNHYSGGSFYYAGEWYWGVDRLFYLESRLRSLNACKDDSAPFLVPRPPIDAGGVDASAFRLDFYPSLNSPYTSIIYDKTIEVAKACRIELHHKPVLPMIMRGVAATRAKGTYIMMDTKREADFLGVPFGPMNTPIGDPTRRAYSLLPWATSLGKDIELLSSLLKCAFSEDMPLHKQKGFKSGVERAGLDWNEARKHLGSDAWKPIVEAHQDEMVDGLGLWGVPSFKLSGPDGEDDIAVWGQDRLWLIAAEIKRRAGAYNAAQP